MNDKNRLIALSVALLAIVLCARHGNAQGHFLRTITFDGPPVVPPGTGLATKHYYEDSMTFTPINPGEQFSRAGGGREAFPENGSAYILQALTYSLAGSRGGVSRFGLYSVDLAEFSTLYADPWTIQFIGYRFDGTIVMTEFITDGIIDGTGPLADFQTFYFDSRFDDLVRFEAPGYGFAMDNLVFFDVVPEPSSGALVALGGLVLWLHRRRGRTSGSR